MRGLLGVNHLQIGGLGILTLLLLGANHLQIGSEFLIRVIRM